MTLFIFNSLTNNNTDAMEKIVYGSGLSWNMNNCDNSFINISQWILEGIKIQEFIDQCYKDIQWGITIKIIIKE